jgi:CheY-like chemotaxis protein
MGGLECAREIRRRNFDIPIIAVTANARSEQVREASQTGRGVHRNEAKVEVPFAFFRSSPVEWTRRSQSRSQRQTS